MSENGLAPRWASAPGETIAAVMTERGIELNQILDDLHVSDTDFGNLIRGQMRISPTLADCLSTTFGGSTEFWLIRDAQYREDLDRVHADEWAQQFPVKQMSDFGWIKKPKDWHEQIESCLDFFQVETPLQWESTYKKQFQHAHYRRSPTFDINSASTTAWFRACEQQAELLGPLPAYDATHFEDSLKDIKRLTRQKDPRKFIPELVGACAATGVAVVIVRAPEGCPASGAARQYGNNPLIQLTARHLTDDHFWFSFFHEAAHVIKDPLDQTYLDLTDPETGNSQEIAADEFAQQILIPKPLPPLSNKINAREAIHLAHKNEVSPGVIVGHLQHLGAIPFQRLNKLKRRYIWRGVNLEMQ